MQTNTDIYIKWLVGAHGCWTIYTFMNMPPVYRHTSIQRMFSFGRLV